MSMCALRARSAVDVDAPAGRAAATPARAPDPSPSPSSKCIEALPWRLFLGDVPPVFHLYPACISPYPWYPVYPLYRFYIYPFCSRSTVSRCIPLYPAAVYPYVYVSSSCIPLYVSAVVSQRRFTLLSGLTRQHSWGSVRLRHSGTAGAGVPSSYSPHGAPPQKSSRAHNDNGGGHSLLLAAGPIV